jgi:hypothetical protein
MRIQLKNDNGKTISGKPHDNMERSMLLVCQQLNHIKFLWKLSSVWFITTETIWGQMGPHHGQYIHNWKKNPPQCNTDILDLLCGPLQLFPNRGIIYYSLGSDTMTENYNFKVIIISVRG